MHQAPTYANYEQEVLGEEKSKSRISMKHSPNASSVTQNAPSTIRLQAIDEHNEALKAVQKIDQGSVSQSIEPENTTFSPEKESKPAVGRDDGLKETESLNNEWSLSYQRYMEEKGKNQTAGSES